jgi:hypothetical protein
MLRSVPGGKVRLGLPAIVTKPDFEGCLNCRWLPEIRTIDHPSASISLMISLTFIGTKNRLFDKE